MKKYLVSSLVIAAALCLGGCSKEILSEQPIGETDIHRIPESGDAGGLDKEVFSLLDLDCAGLENVKRFYLDWDKDKLNEIVKNGGSTIIYPHPFNFGVEYSWDIENEDFSMVQGILRK